jgi:hypothetical protein
LQLITVGTVGVFNRYLVDRLVVQTSLAYLAYLAYLAHVVKLLV